MNATEIFENHGLTFNDADHAAEELASFDLDELWNITDSFLIDALEVSGDEEVQTRTLRTALVNAFANDQEFITQNDFDLAREQALEIVDFEEGQGGSDAGVSVSTVEAPETEPETVEAEAETTPAPKKRKPYKKRSSARKLIAQLIKQDPTADAETIVTVAQEQVSTKYNTLISYYYIERRAQGLAGTGKLGRRPNDTDDTVREIIAANWGKSSAEIIAAIHDDERTMLSENSSRSYFYRLRTDIEGNEQ